MTAGERMIFMSRAVSCRRDVTHIVWKAGEKEAVLGTGPLLPSITAPSTV